MTDCLFNRNDNVSITQIAAIYPPRQSSLQEYFNKNPEKLAEKNGTIPEYAVPAGEVNSFTEWGQPKDEPGEEDSEILGKCMRISSIGDADKPKIVFVHGFPDSPQVWKRQIEFFKDDYCIILVHFPFCSLDPKDCDYQIPFTGFAISEIAAECNEVIGMIMDDDEKVHLVGHDFGCKICNEMVAQDSQIYHTLTLLGVAPTGNQSPFHRFLLCLMQGFAYEYALIMIYLFALFISTDIASVLHSILFSIWPPFLLIRWMFVGSEVPESNFHPAFTGIYLQKHLTACQTLFHYNCHTIKDSIVPILPTYYAYGSSNFNNPAFKKELQTNTNGYKHEKIGDNHWFFYTHAKEFNEKLKAFICKYS